MGHRVFTLDPYGAGMHRRHFLLATGGAALGAAIQPVAASAADRPIRVLVATSEPWGTYHIEHLLDEASVAGRTIAMVVPDRSHLEEDDATPVVTVAEAAAWGADVLVVNSALEWPVRVARALSDVPVVAASLAYLTPEEAPGAAELRPRLVAMTAGSGDEAGVFAAHFGVPRSHVAVVGNPALDDLPAHRPEPGSVVVATSVTHPDETGEAAPGAELLMEVAGALADSGRAVRVGLHPREDPALWSRFEIAEEGTVEASARAEVCVGIPGSVFPNVAAVGCPLVGVTAPGLETPDYILSLCAAVTTRHDALEAVDARWRPDSDALRRAIGPVGGSGERLWRRFESAAQRGPVVDTGWSATTGPAPMVGAGLVLAGAALLGRGFSGAGHDEA